MKIARIIVVAIIAYLGSICIANAQFIDEDYTQASLWVDPTFTDNGFQVGLEIQKIMHWGYVSAAASVYDGMEVRYKDLIVTIGINFNLCDNDVIRYYAGFRSGFIFRDDTTVSASYPMAGGVVGCDIRLSRFNADTKFYIGPRIWTDYREDQKDQHFGSAKDYKRGWITNNPLLQENGAIVLSISW